MTNNPSLVPCTGVHYADKGVVCPKREGCQRWSEEVGVNKAMLIVGINIKVLKICEFYLGES